MLHSADEKMGGQRLSTSLPSHSRGGDAGPRQPSPASTRSPSEEVSWEPQRLHRGPQEPQRVNQHPNDFSDNWTESQARPQELRPQV